MVIVLRKIKGGGSSNILADQVKKIRLKTLEKDSTMKDDKVRHL